MELSTITTTDFKTLFRRDFPYLPTYDSTKTYNIGDKVYYSGLFYEAKTDGIINILPTVTASWNKVSDNADNYIQDDDITRAFQEAEISFNQGLFGTDDQIKMGYLYLTAHYLVNDIRTSMQGISSVGEQTVSSRTVGSVSESYSIPDHYVDNPTFAFYTKSGYGLKYLNMVFPRLRGNFGVVDGTTMP